jgi:S1-C subfamily serine protease
MRHAALAALLASLAAPALAQSSDADFAGSLNEIQATLRSSSLVGAPAGGETRGLFQRRADWVRPRRHPTLDRLDREQQDLYTRAFPATFIVRVGQRGQSGSGTGSGYFINPDGTGMTNVHVAGAVIGSEVELDTVRGVKRARVIAAAPGRDIAIIKVVDDSPRPFRNWPALVMGASLNAGRNVFAIGNPVDQGSTFTRGIVSHPNQDGFSAWMDVLQLDIELNPGNSGGALIDSSGRLVGMNQAILRGGTVNGIGFAIPVQELARARDEFASTGRLEDGVTHLGVAEDDLTVVTAPGAAGQAGLRPADSIQSFPGLADAVPGRRAMALYRAVGHSRPGQTIPLRVARSEPVMIHTSAAAGGTPVASAHAFFNPSNGKLIAPGTPELAAFAQAVTEQSVEELEYNGQRYTVAVQGQPQTFGIIFSVQGFANKLRPTETLNLPVELYVPEPEEAAAPVGEAPAAGASLSMFPTGGHSAPAWMRR